MLASKFTLGLYQSVHQADSWPKINYNKTKKVLRRGKNPSHMPPATHVYMREKEVQTQNWNSDRKGIKIVLKSLTFFLPFCRLHCHLFHSSQTQVSSVNTKFICSPQRTLFSTSPWALRYFFLFFLECYMKLQGAAEYILITKVYYSLWNRKNFFLNKAIHSKASEKKFKYLEGHVQEQ